LSLIRITQHLLNFILLLLCISLSSTSAFGSSSEQTTVKLQLFWHHQFEFAGFYAAIEQGYFKKYNIEVELIKFDPSSSTTDSVLKGKAQFGIAGTEIIESYHQGKDVILLASYFKRSPLIIITQPEITSLKQLSNHKVHGSKQQLKQGSIREMLDLFDVEQTQINITMKGKPIALFENKEVDGILTYRTDVPYQLNQKDLEYRMYDPNQYGIASQDLNLFTTGAFARENPELVRNFTLAANEGWNYAINHPNEIIDLILSKYNTQNLTKGALKYESNETIKLISPELFEIGSIQKNKLRSISEQSFANKSITSIKNLNGFIFQLNPKQEINSELLKLLTFKERKYLNEHTVIKVQNESDYPPFNYIVKGKPSGYSIDYMNMLAKKMGVSINFIQNKLWHEYIQMLRSNQLDAMINIVETTDRKELFSFTASFAEPSYVAVTRDDNDEKIINEHSIKNKRPVVVEGYVGNDIYKKLYPSMNVIKVKSVLAALKTITAQKADLFISNDAVINFYIEKHYLAGLKLVSVSEDLNYPETNLSIATNLSNPTLKNIFQKAMSTIEEHENLALRKKWLGEMNNDNKISVATLTQDEKNYLANNPIIRVQNDENYPPFNYLIDGKPSGYSIDLINLMASTLGIEVQLSRGKSWAEYMDMLKENELDALINIIDIDARHDFAAFTSPFANISTFAVTRENEFSSVISKDDLRHKRIAITKGYAINNQLLEILTESIFIEVGSTTEALEFISLNQADVYFEAGAVLKYYLAKNILSNLQLMPVSSSLEVINQKFSIATHKDNKILLGILQKALNAIPDIEHIRLKQKWFGESQAQFVKSEKYSLKEIEFIKNADLTLCRPALNQGSSEVIPLIDLITKDLDLKIKMSRPMLWAENLIALENKECDILLEATKTAKRQEIFNFTSPYFRDELVIITLKEQKKISDLYDYPDKYFAILKGHSVIKLLKMHYPKVKFIEVDTSVQGIELIMNNKVFGYINSQSFTNNLMKNGALEDLKINTTLRGIFDDLQAIATRKEDKILHNVLSKALTNTDEDEINKIIANSATVQNSIKFSPEELSILKNREVVLCVAADTLDWKATMPFFLQSVDMKLIFSKTFTWENALTALNSGLCDFLPEVTPTKNRLKTMSFTPTIHQEGRVIVTSTRENFINNIEDYPEKQFVVLKGDPLNQQLKESYPNIKIKPADRGLNGLQFVQNDLAFAYIGSISIVSSIMSKYELKDLKISGSLSDQFSNKWSIATRKDDKHLNSILSKIVSSFSKKDIRKKLFEDVTVKYVQEFDYTFYYQLLSIFIVILTATIFWNRRLAALNLQLKKSNKVAEAAQQKVESQNDEILATHQQLVQSEKMASLGTLTAGVAHEINNPTNFTHAAVYMMQSEIDEIKEFLRQLAGGDNADADVINSFDEKFEKLTELAKTASEGTNRIKVIVEDLRTFARLDDAKQAQIQVSELITSTVHLVKTQFENIIINTEFEYDPVLTCFPSKLNQVFMNIIVNACQSIKTKIKQNKELDSNYQLEGLINISTSVHDDYLIINITDNGCGMDKLTQQKVCEPFFTTKDVGSGTGLGMAISFGIIEEHDGMLKIASQLTSGSDFSIYLPVKTESPDNKKIRNEL